MRYQWTDPVQARAMVKPQLHWTVKPHPVQRPVHILPWPRRQMVRCRSPRRLARPPLTHTAAAAAVAARSYRNGAPGKQSTLTLKQQCCPTRMFPCLLLLIYKTCVYVHITLLFLYICVQFISRHYVGARLCVTWSHSHAVMLSVLRVCCLFNYNHLLYLQCTLVSVQNNLTSSFNKSVNKEYVIVTCPVVRLHTVIPLPSSTMYMHLWHSICIV